LRLASRLSNRPFHHRLRTMTKLPSGLLVPDTVAEALEADQQRAHLRSRRWSSLYLIAAIVLCLVITARY
jgi:hypothetical protein